MRALTFPRYRTILLGLFALCLASVWGLALYLRPLDGDLTRVGGYTENAFHWTQPQQTFSTNLFHISKKLEDYDRYYDVVVLGDSFSCDQEPRRFGWQNFFLKQTGLSMIVFDTREYWPLQVLESPGFRKYPPRFFVFESVERYLHDRTAYFADVPLGQPAPARDNPALTLPQTDLSPIPLELQADQSCLDTDYVLGYLNAVMQRRLHLNNQASKLPLQRGGLFSSHSDRDMLIYFDEVAKKPLTEENLVKMRAGMLRLQALVESNGFTRFIYLIAPDKSAIYAPYLTHASDSTKNFIAIAAQENRLHLVRTDQVLTQEIASGTPDVYLPNDSHWGSIGHRLVAEALTAFLTSPQPPAEKAQSDK